MKNLRILTVLSFCPLVWTATVPVDLTQNNTDPELASDIVVPEGEASPNTESSSKKARQTDTDVSLPSDEEDDDSDVYWRPWKGKIPNDAVVGAYGQNDCGSDVPIYMAQVFHKAACDCGIIPAQIFKKSKGVSVSCGMKEYRYKDNIKILCSDDPSILTWVPVNETSELDITEKDCLIAGADRSFNTFFGRTNYEDETVIGKVAFFSKTMYFPYYGEEKYITKDFEILCYEKAVETKRVEALKRK